MRAKAPPAAPAPPATGPKPRPQAAPARPWWKPAWSAPAAMRAVRATIVIPGLFAITSKVIGDPQMALFATFGGFAALVMTSFGGSRVDKLRSYFGLAVVGSIALVIGTLASGTTWLAAVVTVPVVFALFFAGVLGPTPAGGTIGALLAYVLPVASAGGAATIGSRLEGWLLACAAGTLAVLLLSPRSPADRLRAAAAALAAEISGRLTAAADGGVADPAAMRACRDRLRAAFTSAPYRPTGLTTADQALASVVALLDWGCEQVADAFDGHVDLTGGCPADRALLRTAATAFGDAAALLSGRPATPDFARLEQARAAAAAYLRDLPAAPGEPDRGVAAARAVHAQAIAVVARAAAADALIAARRADPATIAAERRLWYGPPPVLPPPLLSPGGTTPRTPRRAPGGKATIPGAPPLTGASGPAPAGVRHVPNAPGSLSARTASPQSPEEPDGTPEPARAAAAPAREDGTAPVRSSAHWSAAAPAREDGTPTHESRPSRSSQSPKTSQPSLFSFGTFFSGATSASLMAGLAGATGVVARHASVRSVWFANSLRAAVALAAAVAVADLTGVQHGFWVVLGTLSVLRSNAAGTGSTALRALAGTAVGFVVGAALLLAIGTGQASMWVAFPLAVLIAAYAPGTAPFAVGQAAFTIVVVVLFNLIVPVGWKVGLLRIEDVAIGCAVSLVVGAAFWPRGAAALVGDDLADAFRSGAQYLTQAVDWALSERMVPPAAASAAVTAGLRLDDALRGFLAEQGAKRVGKEDLWSLVTATTRLRLTANTLAGLRHVPPPGQAGEVACLPLEGSGSYAGTPACVSLRSAAAGLAGFYGRIADEVGHPGRAAPALLPAPLLTPAAVPRQAAPQQHAAPQPRGTADLGAASGTATAGTTSPTTAGTTSPATLSADTPAGSTPAGSTVTATAGTTSPTTAGTTDPATLSAGIPAGSTPAGSAVTVTAGDSADGPGQPAATDGVPGGGAAGDGTGESSASEPAARDGFSRDDSPRSHPHLLWVQEHLHHLSQSAQTISEPALHIGQARRRPWWR